MSETKEVFKPVKGFPRYEISNTGKVKSLIRNIIMKPALNRYGYHIVSLRENNSSKTKYVHLLVAESLMNHTTCDKSIVVDHIDNNRINNNLSNLQIITQRENTSRRKRGNSIHTGVHWCNTESKWRAQIRVGKKPVRLGYFDNEDDAANAYKRKLKEITSNT